MGERDADDVLDENHEAKRFFPADGHNPASPFPSFPQSPFCQSRKPLSRYSRSPLPVLPAESPFLSFPQFLAGIHSQNSLSLGVNRESYPFGKASTTSEW